VCAHGISRNSSDFIKLGEQLQIDYNVIAIDLIGHGLSDLPASASDYLDQIQTFALAGVLAQIPAAQKIVWLGTSFGGSAGPRLAAQPGSPIVGLILNDVGAVISSTNVAVFKERFRRSPKFGSLAEAKPFIRHIPSVKYAATTDEELDRYAMYNLWPDPVDGGWKLAFDPRLVIYFERHQDAGSDLTRLWENLSCPALIIRGELSRALSVDDVQEMPRLHSRAKTITVRQATHPPELSGPAQVAAMTAWIRETVECDRRI